MKLYGVEIVETVVKRVVVEAEDANDAMHLAADLENDEFDYCESAAINSSIIPFDDDKDAEDDEDPRGGFNDCDECPDHCEVCDSCACESDFVPRRGECADCKFRCSACGACTFDE